MTITPRRIVIGTVLLWLFATLLWGALHIQSILTENPRVLWGEPYVYTLSFQLFAFAVFWLPRSLVFFLFPVLVVEFLLFRRFSSSALNGREHR